ncbi:MAG: hypothetical protein PWQ60_446 [Thermoanaerobacteraceae bacterium]|nr:hypothetical protein [Thermoanaerobacteraceae bacterium]
MKRKALSVLLALALVIGSMTFNTGRVYAEVLTEGDWRYLIEGDGATIVGYDGYDSDVVIPSTLGGYPVVKIGDRAFSNKCSLISVVIPSSVVSIGFGAFEYCNYLRNVELPEGLQEIREEAFQYCTSLESVTIPGSITFVGRGAFKGSGLKSISWPEQLVYIPAEAFQDCISLNSAVIPSTVFSIDYDAFNGCVALTNITLPEGLGLIYERAFKNCTSLGSIILPSSVTLISEDAFAGCSSLAEITVLNPNTEICDSPETFPSQAVIIGYDPSTAKDYAVKYGRTFRVYESSSGGEEPPSSEEPPSGGNEPPSQPVVNFTYTIENGEITITGCENPGSEVVIPESINGYPVTKIGFSAFGYQSSITKVTIPASITYIDYYAFYECSSLTEIVILNPNVYIVDNPGVFPEQAKIVGYDPSTAKDYAIKYGRTFEVYGGGQPSGGNTPPPSGSGTGDGSNIQIIGEVGASTITITAPLVVSFSIDPNNKERPLVTEDLVLTNNGNASVNVYVKSVASQDMQIIPSDSYTVDGWKRLSKFETERKLALLLGGKDLANADNLFLVTLKGKETKSLPVDVKHGLAFPMAKSCSIQVVLSYSLN